MVVVLKVQYNSLIFSPKDFMLLYYQSYVSLLQKDFKILYLFQQQSFSSPTMLKELFWKESPMRYYQGQMQPRASFLHATVGFLTKPLMLGDDGYTLN